MHSSDNERLTSPQKNFLHLFLSDPVQLIKKTYTEYEAQEPGFAEPFMQAYIEAFNAPAEEVLTEEFLKRINATSAAHLTSRKYGNYRTGEIAFNLSSEIRFSPDDSDIKIYSLTYNVNENGLINFIDRWLVKPKIKLHQLMIEPKTNTNTTPAYIIASLGTGKRLSLGTTINGQPVDVVDFNESQHSPFLIDLLKNNNYQFRVNIHNTDTPTNTKKLFSNLTQTFLKLAQRELAEAINNDEKITAIAKLAQSIDQLHPFPGGNIRTCYVLINRLLNDNDMPLCIFLNPNRLDCCDLAEVIRSIKEGQYVYQQWLNNTNPSEFNLKLQKPLATIKTVRFAAHTYTDSVAEHFHNLVVGQRTTPKSSVSQQSIFVLRRQKFIDLAAMQVHSILEKVKNDTHRARMKKALEQQEYSLLLRRACAYQTFAILEVLLPLKYILAININEVSETSNRTALDWLNLGPDSDRKETARSLLIDNYGLTNEDHVNLTLD